jgi:multidrug efflux pump
MFLPELSIRRPVLATVMSLAIVLLGVIAFTRLSVREYPKIDTPVVSVRTVYTGASAQVIESQVTQPLEDSLSGIEGVRTIKSVSREEVSQITVEFVPERNVDAAANDVRDRVARVRNRLPEETQESVVSKIEADAQAIIWLAFYSDQRDALYITDYADRYVADSLKSLPGVASVIIGGERKYAMRIWLDRDRLAGYGLTPLDVENALRRQNIEVPSGRIESKKREFTVLTETDLRTPEQFNNLIITETRGYPVRLSDVGRAELGAADERNIVRVNGNTAVGLGIVKQSTANTLAVAQAVKAQLPRIQSSLPPDVKVFVAFDSSLFIDASINAVYRTILEAMVLVTLVIFLFLRSFRSTLIPFVTIPVSLIGACFFLWLFGFTINILTLLGVVLAIGLVVDDAIVVLENIHRHIEEGMPPFKAAVQGSREIAFAVVAMTVTLAAVFVPLVFATGNTGKLFTEFALTVAMAVLVSGFVSLTLTPMMCSVLLKGHARHGAVYNATERFFTWMNNAYRRSLAWVLRRRLLVIAGYAVILVSMAGLSQLLKSRFYFWRDAGAGRRDGGIHRWLCAHLGNDLQGCAGNHQLLRGGGAGTGKTQSGESGVFVRAPETLGRQEAQPDRHREGSRPEDVRHDAGRAGVREQPAVARPEFPQPAGAVRGAGHVLRGTRPAHAKTAGARAQQSQAGERGQRFEVEQAAVGDPGRS